MTLHNILDAVVRLSITSIPGLQSLVPSAVVRVLVNVMWRHNRKKRYIMLTHLHNRFLPAIETARQLGVDAQTIFIARHMPARLLWTQQHLHWTRRQWHNVTFSDESRFSESHADDRVRVCRRRNERYAQWRPHTLLINLCQEKHNFFRKNESKMLKMTFPLHL